MGKHRNDFDWSQGDVFSRLTREELAALNNKLTSELVTAATKADEAFTKHHRPQ